VSQRGVSVVCFHHHFIHFFVLFSIPRLMKGFMICYLSANNWNWKKTPKKNLKLLLTLSSHLGIAYIIILYKTLVAINFHGYCTQKKTKEKPPFHGKMEVVVFFSLHSIITSKTKMNKYETNDKKGMKSIIIWISKFSLP
jgi:hypothetical protein